MPDAAKIEATIRANRLLKLPVAWDDEIIYPYYDGLSIMNVSRSVLNLLGVTTSAPLSADVWDGTPPDVDRVVLIVLDGLGYQFLHNLCAEDATVAAIVADLTGGHGIAPLTSVAPSTTAAALPAYWLAQPPGRSGMLGTVQFLRQPSLLADILFFRPAEGGHPHGSLESWGVDAEQFVTLPTVANQLNAVDVPVHIMVDRALFGSGLSKIMHRGNVNSALHLGQSDLYLRLAGLLRDTAGQRCYISAYNPAFDSVSHAYGADSLQAKHEARMQLQNLHAVLRDPANGHDGRTLVMIAADHGHADAPNLLDIQRDAAYAPLTDAMRCNFGAEERLAYLYLREGTKAAVIDFLRETLADRVAWVTREEALAAGLFGTGDLHAEISHRVGDLIAIPRMGTRLMAAPHTARMVSAHGGLSSREMMVPLLWHTI
ncbi:MAG: hypothetical protein EA396_04195 [Anaerolineaceae bacterium]|nr:MAG: hypothetical protein EA396_04195 [Anaerolineaceae bacterium]